MKPITMRFGGYQPPASIHNQSARRFGELLEQKLGDRITFELIGSVLDLGRASGDLPVMVENGELSFCYMSTVRSPGGCPRFSSSSCPSWSGTAAGPGPRWTASWASCSPAACTRPRPSGCWASGTTGFAT
jgi:hypothetical protein